MSATTQRHGTDLKMNLNYQWYPVCRGCGWRGTAASYLEAKNELHPCPASGESL